MTPRISHFGPFIPYDVSFFLLHYKLSLFLTCVTSLSLGLFILVRNARNPINRTFAIFMVAVAGWSGFQALIGTWPDPTHWLLIAQVEHLFHVFVPTLILHFVYTIAGQHVHSTRLRISYFISIVSFFLVPKFFIGTNPHDYAKFALVVSPVYLPYMTWFSVTVIEAVLKLHRAVKNAQDPLQRTRLQYVFWATVIGFSGGFPNFLYVYDLDLYPIVPFSTYLVPVFPSLIAYAIVRHQALDIRVVIRKSLVYSTLAAIITAGYFSVILVAEKALQGVMGYRSLIGSLIAGFAITLGFNPLRDLIQQFIDRLFFHSSQATLVEENERLRQEVARSEKLKAVATLAAGMAHEIKNPLASIKTFAEYLPEKFEDPAYREKFARIMSQEVDKMNVLVHRLLEFARPSQPDLEPVHLSALAKDTLDFLQGSLLQKQIHVQTAFTDQDEVSADPAQMKQVLLNLLLNSVDAIEPPGEINISTERKNGHVTLRVRDTGRGIARKDLHRVFDPFFTTKTYGTGLGLSVVHSIVREHKGRVDVASEVGKGTTVRITLPTNGRSHEAATYSDRG